jgi:hypothetical protein
LSSRPATESSNTRAFTLEELALLLAVALGVHRRCGPTVDLLYQPAPVGEPCAVELGEVTDNACAAFARRSSGPAAYEWSGVIRESGATSTSSGPRSLRTYSSVESMYDGPGLMGHTDLATTMRYLAVTEGDTEVRGGCAVSRPPSGDPWARGGIPSGKNGAAHTWRTLALYSGLGRPSRRTWASAGD